MIMKTDSHLQALVSETPDSSSIRVASFTSDIDETVLARIKKCLERAHHANAAEAEAKAALHIASRLMKQYNVSQAEVLAHEPPEVQRQYGGHSCVSIIRRDGDISKPVKQNAFVFPLCDAIETFFNAQSYTEHEDDSVIVVFYGVAENTAMAAHAFEMVFNLMLDWARPYSGMNGKNSYCIGICDGLQRHANEEREKEEADARKAEQDVMDARIKEEEAQRQVGLDRLAELPLDSDPYTDLMDGPTAAGPTGDAADDASSIANSASWCPSWASTSNDGDAPEQRDLSEEEAQYDEVDDSDVQADFRDNSIVLTGDDDADIDSLMSTFVPRTDRVDSQYRRPSEPATILDHAPEQTHRKDSVEPLGTGKEDEEHKWSSHSQLMLFRDTAKKIAQDYIKDQGIKISNARTRKFDIDQSAYRQGKRDSKKINVRGKTIRDTAAVEHENAPSYVFTE